MEILNVTEIEPRLKHPAIFGRFDALSGGEAFVIHNDHDPKPLYYQMIAKRGQTFGWEYLAQGPDVWQVRITKLEGSEKPATVGEMVAADYRRAEVFRKFGIDYCCGGKRTVEEACRKKGIDPDTVKKELADAGTRGGSIHQDYNRWQPDFLADYIVATHHRYVTESLPMLYELSAKVARVHGDSHPETVDIARHFEAVAQELQMHMHKEEHILFPYIKQLAAARRDGKPVARPPFGTIANPIRMMEAEHESAGGSMEEIRQLSDSFTPPEDACMSYRVLYAKLNEFEQDLHQHIHLENNILFPKAVDMEATILG